MTIGRAAIYGGGVLLVAWLAAANNAVREESTARARSVQREPVRTPSAVSAEVQQQAARLRERLAAAPLPADTARNPFAFGARRAPRPQSGMIQAASIDVAASPAPLLPPLTLVGIAEDTAPAGPVRTAIIAGDGDALFMVTEGQAVAGRYTVSKIGVDAVELHDRVTNATRRLALR
jgi:hypothetical protein